MQGLLGGDLSSRSVIVGMCFGGVGAWCGGVADFGGGGGDLNFVV